MAFKRQTGAGGRDHHKYPQKRFFRSRAHCNPLSNNDGFEYPVRPSAVMWSDYYPGQSQGPDFVDIGCGFGGLTESLARLAPAKRVLGLEIRSKVCEFVRRRIEALRSQHPGKFNNAACIRHNTMLHLPNLIARASCEKLFFCFPDPHFKAKNHRRRIVSTALLAEYAYVLKPDGLIYCVTDVQQLHQWHLEKLQAHPLFAPHEIEDSDPYIRAILGDTEEGQKVSRNYGTKFWTVFRRKKAAEVDMAPRLLHDKS